MTTTYTTGSADLMPVIPCDACGAATPRSDLETMALDLSTPGRPDMALTYIHINPAVCTPRAKANHRGIYHA